MISNSINQNFVCPSFANTGGSRKYPGSLLHILDEAEIKELIRGTRSRIKDYFGSLYGEKRFTLANVQADFGKYISSDALTRIKHLKYPLPIEAYLIFRYIYMADLNAVIAGDDKCNTSANAFIPLTFVEQALKWPHMFKESALPYLQSLMKNYTTLVNNSDKINEQVIGRINIIICKELENNPNLSMATFETLFLDAISLELDGISQDAKICFNLDWVLEWPRKRKSSKISPPMVPPSILAALHLGLNVDLNELVFGEFEKCMLQDMKELL